MSLAVQNNSSMVHFDKEQVDLIKGYLCKGITDEELKLFSAVCKKTGLDPFMKQIYAVKRKDQMTIQTSIDGYRLIAERTGRYAPGRESTYLYDKNGQLLAATSYVKKQTKDGTWHEIGATAFLEEYKPTYANAFWDTKKHIMTAKCAETLALRKAFPNELSGLYTDDEMHQADNGRQSKSVAMPIEEKVSQEDAQEIEYLLTIVPIESKETVLKYVFEQCKANGIADLKREAALKIKERLQKMAMHSQQEVVNA